MPSNKSISSSYGGTQASLIQSQLSHDEAIIEGLLATSLPGADATSERADRLTRRYCRLLDNGDSRSSALATGGGAGDGASWDALVRSSVKLRLLRHAWKRLRACASI